MNKRKQPKVIKNQIKLQYLTIEGGIMDGGEVEATEFINATEGYRSISLSKPIHGVATFWSSDLGTVRVSTYFQRVEKYNPVEAIESLIKFQEERKRINHVSYITANKRYEHNIERLNLAMKEVEDSYNESDI